VSRGDARGIAAPAALLVLVGLASGCGRGDPPRLKASALPAAAAVAGATDVRVQLRNVGGRALALDGVGRVCGCAPTAGLPTTLAPGAAAMLDLRCRAPRTTAATERELVVHTNDPSKPAAGIPLALPGVGPGPAPLYFGYVAVGTSAVRDVVLSGPLPSARSTDPSFAVEPLPTRPDGAVGVRVRFTPARAGVVRATLDLGPTESALPVVAVGHGDAIAVPAEVRLPAAGGALPAISVVGVGPTPLAIIGAEFPAGMQGELRTIVAGRQLRLVLRRAPGAPLAGGTIHLRGADGTTPVLAIPVLATGDDRHASGRHPGAPAT
jgi:hypothetical protein